MKFKKGDRVRCTSDNPEFYLKGWTGTVRPDGSNSPLINWDNGKSTYCNESFLKLIKEDTMKERVLKDDEVMERGDIVHRADGSTWIVTGLAGDRVDSMPEMLTGLYTKVTRGGKKMKEKIKQYPKKFFVQHHCPTNNDDDSIDAEIEANELNLNHPMLEITQTKGKFKVRQVTITEKRTYVTKEVK